VPVDLLAEEAADERRQERAQVDPHVEDREARVATRIVLRVEAADHGAHVRLQQPGPDHDHDQPAEHRRHRRDRGEQMPKSDDQAPDQDGAAVPEDLVGQPAAGQ
jgi:hypothetical protein